MSARNFLDSNVLVYSDDHGHPEKQKVALSLIERCRRSGDGVVSTQVLQEYFAVVTRKLSVPMEIARRKVQLFARFPVVKIDVPDILAAIDLQRLHKVSFWDALIVRGAQQGGCSILYTEDLHDGWNLEGLSIANPFQA
jgi:predicted nucleic acid-binding protein